MFRPTIQQTEQFESKIKKEQQKRDEKEMEIRKMEEEEMELLRKLQETQRRQAAAMDVLEDVKRTGLDSESNLSRHRSGLNNSTTPRSQKSEGWDGMEL